MANAPTSEGESTEWARLRPAAEIALPCALFLVAAALRLAHLAEVSSGLFFESGGVDTTTYMQRAFEGLGAGWPGGFAFDQPPLYPLWLAAIGSVVGPQVWAIKFVQAILGSLSCLFVYRIGRRAFRDARIGIAAGFFCAFNGTLIYFDGQIVSTNLEIFLVCSALLALLRARDGDRVTWWLIAGLAMGLAIINRGAMLFSLPWLVWWMFRKETWESGPPAARGATPVAGLRRSALVCLPVALCILPVTLHNFQNDRSRSAPALAPGEVAASEPSNPLERFVSRDFVFITSRVAMNLHLGNVPEHYATNDPNHRDCFSHANHVMKLPYRTTQERTASGQQRVLFAETRRAIAADPAGWLGLMGYKALHLVNGQEIPRNANLYAERAHSTVLRALLWPGPIALPGGILFPLALLGLWLDRRRWRERFALLALLWPRAAFVITFFVAARLRLPLVPILTLFAALAAVWLFDRIRAWEPAHFGKPLAAATLFAVVVNLPLAEPHTGFGAYEYVNHADHLARQGAHTVAVTHYRKALDMAPDSTTVRFKLAVGLDRAGQSRAAVDVLEETLRLDPRFVEAAIRLGKIHRRDGRLPEARLALDRALAVDSNNRALRRLRDALGAPVAAAIGRP